MLPAVLASVAAPSPPSPIVFYDMHDGDQKAVTFDSSSPESRHQITIKPYANTESWVVNAPFDTRFQNASIDFNVPGKPGPPPVNLTLSYELLFGPPRMTTLCAFTDPSGTLASPPLPLNAWISKATPVALPPSMFCPSSLSPTVYADMHDGDRKQLTISDGTLTILPSGNNQSWVVKAALDPSGCNATVDFDVPGKPNPPPVKLTAVLQQCRDGSCLTGRHTAVFYDPSGTIAPATQPLNAWLSI